MCRRYCRTCEGMTSGARQIDVSDVCETGAHRAVVGPVELLTFRHVADDAPKSKHVANDAKVVI
ncbi:protein of unknown function [Pararobbsia alpina]